MGGRPSKELIYSVPLQGTETEESTCVRRAFSHPNELVENFDENKIQNTWDLFKMGVSKAADEDCLGTRVKKENGKFGEYAWKTYREVEEIALCVATSLMEMDAAPERHFDVNEGDDDDDSQQQTQDNQPNEQQAATKGYRFLGLYAKNREEWTICEQACNVCGIAIVPLYDTLGHDATAFIISQTSMKSVVASDECAEKLLTLPECPESLKNIILLDEVNDTLKKKAEEMKINLIHFKQLIEDGKKVDGKEEKLRPHLPTGDTVNTLCYTSGTTGKPKGVIMTHTNFVATVAAVLRGPLTTDEIVLRTTDIHISYLPMAHVFERVVDNLVFSAGARIGFFSGDTQKLLDDIQVLKPTIFCSVPRLFNRINDKVIGGLREKSAVAQFLFQRGMNAKIARIHQNASPHHGLWDNLVFNKTRQLMGGNVRYMLTGSAPLEASVQDRMKALFCAPLLEGYGMTESMGASFLTSAYDTVAGHIGGPFPSVEFKILSIPEMDYFVNDKDIPKGELVLRGPSVSPGYFRNKKETKEAFKDGWLHTGDVAALLPNGSVKIIDRMKNIFKLAQGEYIAPEKIENIYAQALLVSQIFVFGYSSKSVLVAVVVPDAESAVKWAKSNNKKSTDFKSICKEADLKNAVFDEMKTVAKEGGLKGFECVKDIYIIDEPFSIENDLLTPTFKLKRHQALQRYKSHIDEMYDKLG